MDLTLDELFRWQAPAEITIKGRTVKVLLKTLGEAAEKDRRDKAMAASRLALRDFDDTESLLHINRVRPMLDMPEDKLRELVFALQLDSFKERAGDEIIQYKDDSVRSPESLTEVIEQSDQSEQDEKERIDAEANWVKAAMVSFEQDYDAMERGQREAEALRLLRELVAREAYMARWISCTLHRSVYTESGDRLYYASLDQWDNADQGFREKAMGCYLELDKASRNPNF